MVAKVRPYMDNSQALNGDKAVKQRVVVVTPTYDERDNIADLITAVLAEQAQIPAFEVHVLVSDSCSTDGTLDIVGQMAAADARIHLLNVQQRGIGIGLLRGFQYAIEQLDADVLVEMDSDFQHNPQDLPTLLAPLQQGYEVVVGSRFIDGSVNNMPFYRRVLSVGANQVIRLALGLQGVTEITTSFRAFRKDAFLKLPEESVPWHETSFIAVPVFLVRMLEHGAKATEVPMTMHPRVRGYSKMIYWRYILDILRFAVKDRWRRR